MPYNFVLSWPTNLDVICERLISLKEKKKVLTLFVFESTHQNCTSSPTEYFRKLLGRLCIIEFTYDYKIMKVLTSMQGMECEETVHLCQ